MNWVRTIKNIPLRFHEERSDQLAAACAEGWRRVYLSPDAYVVCPNDALVISIWRFHTFCRGGRKELFDFLDLARDCRRFLDLGASAGIFSALFANTRQDAEIVSVEPDRRSFELLGETAGSNQANQPQWRKLRAAVSAEKGKVRFHSDGLGGTISHDETHEEILVHSLESLTEDLNWIPEVIKIDVESYEFEILTAAVDWLKARRPRLFLEFHWSLLEDRGHSPARLLDLLDLIGYRRRGRRLTAEGVRSELDSSGCARLMLDVVP
jgi:FkbM family methyltransferase